MLRLTAFRFIPTAAALALSTACGVQTAVAAEAVIKLQPAQENAISALALRHKLTVGKLNAQGEWTVSAEVADMLQALRDDASVLWAESARAVVVGEKMPRLHPRVLRVDFNESVQLNLANAKSRWMPELRAATQKSLSLARIRAGALSVALPAGATDADLAETMSALQAHPDVVAVERMKMVRVHAAKPFAPFNIPNDPFFNLQWSLQEAAGGMGALRAWSLAGTSPVTVAVIDTGYTDHPDLNAKWVPGYDFIRERYISVDGDGMDGDPSDQGDFEDYDDCGNSYRYGSSWHGTHVAGIIAAQANNGQGIAGVAPNARIQPIRVLGRCGGFSDDVADGIRWAAGGSVPGAPTNTNPAKVLNLSLGGEGRCDAYTQAAIDYALSRGASVVVSAGNSADDAQNYSPANCKGVITVAATDRNGSISEYSNLGPSVEIAAPGGGAQGFNQVISTLNAGSVGASGSYYQAYQGTSMAAPHVAGTIALMLSRDPTLSPGRILNILQNTAFDKPSATIDCSTNFESCYGGRLDAAAAVAAVADRRHASEITNAPGRVPLIELWNRSINSFHLTTDLVEVQTLLSGARGGDWVRSGQVADTFDFTAQAVGVLVPQPVCRVHNRFNNVARYALNRTDCDALLEAGYVSDGTAFMAELANGGACAAGSTPVYEFSSVGERYRYALSEIERQQSIRAGWQGGKVVFCLPSR